MIRRETIISTNATIDWIIIPFQLPDERPGPGWPVVALAHGRGSMPAREKVYQQGVIWWYRFLQGFQIFKSATLLKSASLVARFVNPFRFIIARWAESIANKRYSFDRSTNSGKICPSKILILMLFIISISSQTSHSLHMISGLC